MSQPIFRPPQSNLETDPAMEPKEFYVVSVRKFAILYLGTMGWYGLYWFYRHWSDYGRFTGRPVLPVIRAIFAFIFTFPLFYNVDQSLRRQGRGRMRAWLLSASVLLGLGVAGVALSLAAETARGEFSAVWFRLVVALLTAQMLVMSVVQRKMNIAALDSGGNSNAALNSANWGWLGFGSLIWLVNLAALLMPDT